ncbi:MAG: hypothetical protein ICV66_12240, partial [Chitinophagaceae bacterium]|nr:hypothetical protein [Chitinophagaceae bacterium]
MKNYTFPLVILIAFLTVTRSSLAQKNPKSFPNNGLHRCGTMEVLDKIIKKNPAILEEWRREGERRYKQYLKQEPISKANRENAATTNEIIIP